MGDGSDPGAALAGAVTTPFWWDDCGRPEPLPGLSGAVRTDLAVVGGGYAGLWTALLAKRRDPGRDVLLVEGRTVGWAASGRNGGFVSASLTHGRANGERHLPDEVDRLDVLGRDNLDAIGAAVQEYGWNCGFERTGMLSVATKPYQVDDLRGQDGFLDADTVRAEVNSPTYLAGVWDRRDTALVHPVRLVAELRQTCLELGVRLAERTPVRRVESDASGVVLRHDRGTVTADRAVLATNVFPALLRRYRLHTVPVWDYVLVTQPLTTAQRSRIGWAHRQGLEDLGNQFHYYRLTDDGRILFGGYDAIYHFGRSLDRRHEQRRETFVRLAAHFFATFPQLGDVRFSHAWGGAIDTCTRFFPFFGTGHGGRVAHLAGFTGLGVGATRFAAQVGLDLVEGADTELTRLRLVRTRPLPFPPEPLAWLGVRLTTGALQRADRHDGRRGPWLRAMDRVGIGFDS